jgi:hypothetical protein
VRQGQGIAAIGRRRREIDRLLGHRLWKNRKAAGV